MSDQIANLSKLLSPPPGGGNGVASFLKAVSGPIAFLTAGWQIGNGLIKWGNASAKKENPQLAAVDQQVAKDSPIPVVYGLKKIAGQIIFREDTLDPIFDMAVALCEGEVEEISNVQVNGRDIEEIGASSYTLYTGTATQTADSRFSDGQATIPCEADCYIWDGAKDTNYNTDLLAISYRVDGERRTYLRFSFDNTAPTGLNITSAQVRIQKSTVPGTEKRNIVGYGVASESWGETTLTWNSAPARGAKYIDATLVSQGGIWSDLVLNAAGIAALKAAYAAGTSLSIELSQDDDESLTFKSKESEYVAPSLIMHYSGATANAFRNTAYIALTIDNSTGLAGGNYPEVTAYVKGCKVRIWNGTSWDAAAFSRNPSWILHDIMTHQRRGMGALFDENKIDSNSALNVANQCAGLLTRPDGATEERYLCDVAFATRATAWQAIQEICAATGIFFQEHDGKIYFAIEKNGTANHTLTENDFIEGSFSYSENDPYDTPNVLRVSYTEPAEDFKEVYVQAESESDIADYGMKLTELRLSTVNRKYEALRFAHWQLWRGLQVRRTFSARLSIKHADMIAGDIVAVTHSLPGWSGKLCRIVDVREDANDELEITGQEYLERTAALETNLPNSAYVESTGSSGGTATIPNPPDAPTWTLTPVKGGWEIRITGRISGALSYPVYTWNEDTQSWYQADVVLDGQSDAAQAGTGLSRVIYSNATGRTYGRFKLQTVSRTETSAFSDEQAGFSLINLPASWTPTAPTLSTPVISRLLRYNTASSNASGASSIFSIRNTITAATDEADDVNYYELRRRDDGGTSGATYGAWKTLPVKAMMDPYTPHPRIVYYDNTDQYFVCGHIYQYAVRAIAQNGKASARSDSVEITLTDDTTAPDKPTFTVSERLGHVYLDIAKATQDGANCPDFDHFKIEGSENGGAWVTLEENWGNTGWPHSGVDADLEVNWSYRITAYDHAGNPSTVSDASANAKKKKVSNTALSGSISPDKVNLSLQGWQLTSVFSATDYRVVAWSAGALITGDGTSYSIGGGNTGNMTAATRYYIYFDSAVSTTALQSTTTAATAVGTGKILCGMGYPNADTAKYAAFQMFGGAGAAQQIITTDMLAADCITANEVLANTFTGAEFSATANLTVGTSNDVVRLSGDDSTYRIWAGHATAGSASFRVTKEGALTATAATIQTATGDQRIVMATTGSGEGASSSVSLYVGGVENARMGQIDIGDDSLGFFYVTGADTLEYGGTYNGSLIGWGFQPSADFSLGLPTGSGKFCLTSQANIHFDTSSKAIKVTYGGSTYTYSKDA